MNFIKFFSIWKKINFRQIRLILSFSSRVNLIEFQFFKISCWFFGFLSAFLLFVFFFWICLISNFYFSVICFEANFKMIYTVNQLVGILLRHAVLSLTHFISPYPSFSGIRHKNLMLISLFLSANKLIYRKSLNLNPNNFICEDNVNRSFKYLM